MVGAFSDYEEVEVLRIVDGDTILVQGEEGEVKVRLLGINSPEKGERGSVDATKFLEDNLLNESVKLYFEGEREDRYGRTLGYVFLGDRNINLESVLNGFSNYYFPSGVSMFTKDFQKAWEDCLNEDVNLCLKSDNSCVFIYSVDFDLQILTLKNSCPFDVSLEGWSLKDEGRKNIFFEDVFIESGELYEVVNEKYDYVWTESGDSAFLRDERGRLVDFVDFRG